MIFYRNSATCSLCILRCCLSRTPRPTFVKTLFYSYGVCTGSCVGFYSVLIDLRNLSSNYTSVAYNVELLLYSFVLVLLILRMCRLPFVGEYARSFSS